MNTSIPNWLACTQLIAFVVVYAVWILPETTALRNIALIIGAVASLYPIYLFRASIFSKNLLPIWFMLGLFTWVIFHYFFIGENHEKQLEELNSIWKYAFILGIFGLGLGITLQQLNKSWINNFFLIALSAPVIIFLIKMGWIYLASKYSLVIPEYIKIPVASSKYYIQKLDYIFFSIPAFIYSLVNIYLFLSKDPKNSIYLFTFSVLVVFFTNFLFFEVNSKNGMMFSFIFTLFFLIFLSRKKINSVAIFLVLLITIPLYTSHILNNPTWINLIPDLKIAIQTENFQEWKNPDASVDHIINEKNNPISMTTYHRIAWAVEGSKMIPEYFVGYGLVEDSFRYLSLDKWPNTHTSLNHTHSGWIDIALGLGVIGAFFLLGSLVIITFRSLTIISSLNNLNLIFFCFFNSVGILLIGITNEISAKSTFPFLIFWILFMSVWMQNMRIKVEKS